MENIPAAVIVYQRETNLALFITDKDNLNCYVGGLLFS